MKEMPVAEVKRDFKQILDAAERGESTVVLRHGKPVAVVGPFIRTRTPPPLPKPRKPGGLLSMVGALSSWETLEEDMAQIVADRQKEMGRPPPDFGD